MNVARHRVQTICATHRVPFNRIGELLFVVVADEPCSQQNISVCSHIEVKDLNVRKKLMKGFLWSTAFCGVESWILPKADQKYMESSEMWWWRKAEKISWTDRVRNEEV